MVRTLDRGKVNPAPQDAREIRRDAMRFLRAHEFLRSLNQHRNDLSRQQLLTLRGQALAGDVDGAMKGLGRLLLGRDVE